MSKNIVLKIEIRGKTKADLDLALSEVKRSIQEGNLSGYDSNDDGEYSFDIDGEIP